MISFKEEASIFSQVYSREHMISLMVLLWKGEPFLIEDHLGAVKENWLILVRYPLDQRFSMERCEMVVKQVLERFQRSPFGSLAPKFPCFSLTPVSRSRPIDIMALILMLSRRHAQLYFPFIECVCPQCLE